MPLVSAAPPWMRLGFELFTRLAGALRIHEVLPSASYRLLRDQSLPVQVDLGAFAPGPKDMLDAYVCAATVLEFENGRGCSVGGGDGLGPIVLPRPLPEPIEAVLHWPTTER